MVETRSSKARKRSKSQDVTQHGANEVKEELAASIPTSAINSFDLLNEDVHRHILSYRMCLREGNVNPADTPLERYREEHRDRVSAENPDLSFFDVTVRLNIEFNALSDEEKAKYEKLVEPDRIRYEKEEAAMVRPDRLFGIMNGLALVSKRWYNVVGDVMNAQAPNKIISAQNLFKLKSRALKLDLESVCQTFIERVKAEWGDDYVGDADEGERYAVLDLVIPSYGGFASFANLVATEYVKFLIVKCVETIALNKEYMEATPTILEWTCPCLLPPNLLCMLWDAHVQTGEKYASDYQTLIGDLLDDHPDMHADEASFTDHDFARKRDILFAYEKQLHPKGFFFGRFGERLSEKRRKLSKEFNMHAVAERILEDIRAMREMEAEAVEDDNSD